MMSICCSSNRAVACASSGTPASAPRLWIRRATIRSITSSPRPGPMRWPTP
jgi:hypothetical protein